MTTPGHQRTLRLRLGAVVIALIVAVVVLVSLDADDDGRPVPSAPERAFRGNPPPVEFRAEEFALRDALRGDLVRMSGQRGRVVVLTFLESRCRSACPLIASQVAEAVRRLPAANRRQVSVFAVSSNPRDDTAASVRAFLRHHRATDEVRYLNRPEVELRRVWRSYRVLSALESGDADTHSAPVRLYDREGRWVSTLHAGVDLSVENLVHDLAVVLRR